MAERFTVHGAWSTYAGVFVVLTIVETPLVHWALLAYPLAAWTVTILQLATIVWLVADARALARGGVFVNEYAMELVIGNRWRGRIPYRLIESVERGDAPSKRESFAILGANVVLVLREPIAIWGRLGKRVVERVALSIDELDRFERVVSGMVAASRA